MWNIHGKEYDLTSFLDKHPGGKEILLFTKGLDDCTALYESYHAFSDKKQIRTMLDKFEVDSMTDSAIATNRIKHDFTSYDELTSLVKEILPDRQSIKATTSWCILNAATLSIYISLLYFVLTTTSNYMKYVACMMIGITESSIAFNILHDSSHYAISIHPKINNILGHMIQHWILWNHVIWFFHHVYAHHSFTGSLYDPDDRLYTFFDNNYVVNIVCFFLPGQYLLQVLYYFVISITKNYSNVGSKKMSIPKDLGVHTMFSLAIIVLKLLFVYHLGCMSSVCYFTALNAMYYMNVFGDHDFYETRMENHYDGEDWAKRQICNSGNFMNDVYLWTWMFSGINHQIEHHLFPNVCGHVYPKIAPIVKVFCLKKGWPYVHHSTLYDAYQSFMKRILSNKNK
jgi:fatty acid desaturase